MFDASMWKKIKENKEDSMANVNFDMTVEIEEEVYEKIMHWVNKSDHEVSGLGSIEIDEERNVFRVIDAILLEQENTITTTNLSDEDVGKAMYEHHKEQKPGMLKWWWHSHVDMSVFWSGTDMGTMKKLGLGGWFVATVFNQKEEMKSAFIQSSPIRLIQEDVSNKIVNQHDPWSEERKTWNKEYTEKVNEKSYITSVYSLPGYGAKFPENFLSRSSGSAVVVPKKNYVGFPGSSASTKPQSVTEAEEVEEEEVEIEDSEERITFLNRLFNLHENCKITDEELYEEIRNMEYGETEDEEDEEWEVLADGVYRKEDGTIVDDTGTPLLTDEESALLFDDDNL